MNIGKTILCGSVLLAGAFASCKKAGPMKWVDLRYLAEDSYTLTATSPEPIRLKVKSTDPWKVYGTESSWCSITPSEGGASELFDVTVQYTENTELDDRLDTLVIQSDYWIGKWIPVRQKGTAYLNIEASGDLNIGQFGGTAQFSIRANQDWSLVKANDAPWLKLIKTSGHGDANILLAVSAENKGERRFADIDVLNRHDEREQTVRVWQDGVVLTPAQVRMRTTFDAQTLSVKVSSNADWTVEKADTGIGWFEFPQTEFSGDGKHWGVNQNSGSPSQNQSCRRVRANSQEHSHPSGLQSDSGLLRFRRVRPGAVDYQWRGQRQIKLQGRGKLPGNLWSTEGSSL